jgi:glycosyltransferase involved in cell wall biosynthesis
MMNNSPRSRQAGAFMPAHTLAASSEQLRGKRVAMVTYSPYPEDERPRRAIDAFRDAGMTIDLICLGQGNSAKRETSDGLHILRIPMKHRRGGKLTYAFQYGSFIFISSLIFALRALTHRYDLVYVHNMPDILVLSALVPKALGARVILDLHDPMPELMTTIYDLGKDSFSVRCIRSMEKWSIARTNLVITVNQACKRIFAARSCQPEKIIVVMNTPDSRIFPFQAAQEKPATLTDRGKPFVMMYHGTLVERNGLDLAVEALEMVREKMPAAELRVYGPSTPFLERVMERVHAKGMQDMVHYLGARRLEELPHEIEQCDVGIIPNQRNAFTDINTPVRIFDFLANGKPAIAPCTPGIKDYFNEDSLVFFESGNAADLAKQMEYTYSHRDELTEIVRRGQQIYLAHTWEQERQTLLGGVSKLFNGANPAFLS